MECHDIQTQLTHYLYDELTPEACLEIRNHLERCVDCRQTVEGLQKIRQILNLRPEVSPPADLMHKLQARMDQEKIWRDLPWRDYLSGKQAIFKTAISAVCGMAAAIVSVLLIAGNSPANNLSPKVFLICGIMWGAAYIILFRLAFNRVGEAKGSWFRRGIRLDLSRIAILVLVAIAVTTALTGLLLNLETTGLTNLQGLLGKIFGDFYSKTVYFLLSGLCALISLLVGSLLLGSRDAPTGRLYEGSKERSIQLQPLRLRSGQALVHGLIAGCLFTVAIAPGLAILCVPFTFGIYLSTLVGLSLGAIGGSTFGCWLAVRRQSPAVV